MEIRVLGDFDIAREVLLGVTRLFSNPDGDLVSTGPAILLGLFLMWSFLKWALDQEKNPYPAKEFVFGIVFWLIFGGGPLSPKFSVELTSIRENRFQVIDDVPLLAAFPSWLASNFFGETREILEDNFSPLYYDTGSDVRTPDPLSTLIKMYDSGTPLLVEPYLAESISIYMVECYEVEQSLDGSPLASTRSELETTPIHNGLWEKVKVTYNFLTTTYYSEANKTGEEVSCPDAWQRISDYMGTVTFTTKITEVNAARGITQNGIREASQMIYEASAHSTPNPLDVTKGLLLSYMMRDGLTRTSLETWNDKMIFEAHRKRVIEKAGERNLFLQIMIPVITALETFSFFIAPVMMVLSVLGGVGLNLITKYLMLVLFVNLWGFVKVFVDLFTALSVERAFKAASASDPFAFGAYPHTFMEIESLLSVASSMTVAIPMFAMFLLYGGVHSVMGVMRTLGGGSVDGNMAAPSVGTSMNNGTWQMGDTMNTSVVSTGTMARSHSIGSDSQLGTMTASNLMQGAFKATNSATDTMMKSDINSWQNSATQAFSASRASGNTVNGGESLDFSTMSADQKMSAVARRLEETGVVAKGQGGAAVAQLAAGLQAGLGASSIWGNAIKDSAKLFKLDANASGAIQGSWSNEDKELFNKVEGEVRNWGDSNTYTTTGGQKISWSNSDSYTFGNKIDKSASELVARSEQLSKSSAIAKATSAEVANQEGLNRTSTVSLNALDGVTRNSTEKHLNEMYSGFSSEQIERLSSLGIGSTEDLMRLTHKNGGDASSFASNLLVLDAALSREDRSADGKGDLNQTLNDFGIQSKAFKYAGDLVGNPHSAGFDAVANAYDDVATKLKGINDTGVYNTSLANLDKARNPTAEYADRRKGTEEKVETGKADANRHKGDVITGSEGAIDVSGMVLSGVGDKPELKQLEDLKRNAKDIDLRNNAFGNKVLDLAGDAMSNIGSLLSETGRVWGLDAKEQGNAAENYFVNAGFKSTAVSEGFEILQEMGKSGIYNLSPNGVPTSDAYKVNDIFTLITSTPEGRKFYDEIPKTEDGERFKAALAQFAAQKYGDGEVGGWSIENKQQADAISKHRISGALPGEAAEVLIQNAQNGEPNELRPDSYNTREAGAGYLVINTDSLKNDSHIMEMAGFGNGIPEGEHASWQRGVLPARDMIINAEAERIISAGEYNFSGDFTNGTNRAWTDEQLKEGVYGVVAGQSHSAIYDAWKDNDSESIPAAIVGFNSGLGGLADRFSNVNGLEALGSQVREFSDKANAELVENGVVTTNAAVKRGADAADALIKGNDVSALSEFVPVGYNDSSIVSQELKPREENGRNVATVERVADSADGRVMFRGEASFMAGAKGEYSDKAAIGAAEQEAENRLRVNAIHDKYMNVAFMNEFKATKEYPASFTSDSKQEYRLLGVDGDMVATYDGGEANGKFTFTPGDNRLMPTEDNPNYANRSNFERVDYSDGKTGYQRPSRILPPNE